MIEKRWILKPQAEAEVVQKLVDALSIDSSLANLLVQRGIKDYDAAKAFFRPQLSDLHDPFLMRDMDKAVERLEQALLHHEKIMVYGDYDVDGTTAVALVYSFLKSREANVSYFIPERYLDGYGVAYRGIDIAEQEGVKIIIALDCGIKAMAKVEYAKKKGIDFIICDHHLPGSTIPEAVAVLDPQRTDCSYPYKELSGCGVGFKLLQAYCQKQNIPFATLEPLLDLLVVSIASDLVPITGENRVLAYHGLKRLNSNPNKGLQAIITSSGLNEQTISIDDIVFRLGPRLNATGRMETGTTSVDLLTAENDEIADKVGKVVDEQNNDRKNVDRNITVEAIAMVKGDETLLAKKTIVVFNPHWHKGVVGIVASRLIETFYRPTIVLTESNGMVTGSARSIPGFDLYQAIEACSDLLETFGGHLYAAGLSLKVENVEKFIARFEEVAQEVLTSDMLTPQVNIDAMLDFKEITPKFYRILKQFQPFGPGNMSPIFATMRAYSNGSTRKVGADFEHLKANLVQENAPQSFPVIAFGLAPCYDYLNSGQAVDICYSVAENHYQGSVSLQLRAKDIKKSEK